MKLLLSSVFGPYGVDDEYGRKENIMELLPGKIIYLSCNPITQGRDAAFFLEKYDLVRSAAFDFYPNTPHVETLLVFEKT